MSPAIPARRPAVAPAKGPLDSRYFDETDLDGELRRTFQICHECRMCVGYCGTFPSVFAAVDRDVDAGRAVGVELLGRDDYENAADLCWQCKLCYIKCPYTEDEGAGELLDFPRLMARYVAYRARRDGVRIVDRVLGEPAAIGILGGGPAAPITNLINANRLVRKVAEKMTGVSADFPLPPVARQSFPTWLRGRIAKGTGDAGEVVLFATCYGDYNEPNVPRAAVRVLEHLGFRLVDTDQVCCGMPNLDGGDIAAAVAKIRINVAALLPEVENGRKIAVVSPTCGYMMKKEWPHYVDDEATRKVSAATVDLMELLDGLRKEKKLDKNFKRPLGKVAYHAACHLRAQKIAFPGARLLGLVPDTDVRVIEQCSAVDGTWGMKAKNYEMGRRYARKLVREVAESEADIVVTDCQLAGRRIQKENRVATLHPVEALAKAYGLDEG